MLKIVFSFLAVLLPAICFAQTQPKELYNKLGKTRADTNRINALNALGRYYADIPGEIKSNKDSGIYYFKQAQVLSQSLHINDKEMVAFDGISECYLNMENVEQGMVYGLKPIVYYHQINDVKKEAYYNYKLGAGLPMKPLNYNDKIKYYSQAGLLYGQIKNLEWQYKMGEYVAIVHYAQGKYDQAEKEMQQVLQDYNSIGFKKIANVYNYLALISGTKGDYVKKLDYHLRTVSAMEGTADTVRAPYYYYYLSQNYYLLNLYDKSLNWAEKGMRICLQRKDGNMLYNHLHLAVVALWSMHRYNNATELIDQTVKDFKPVTATQKANLYQDQAICYASLKQFVPAEHYYLKSDSVFETTLPANKNNLANTDIASIISQEIIMSGFYLDFSKYEKAEVYLRKAFALPQKGVLPTTISVLHLNQFRVDTAKGNYASALKHYVRFKKITDSILNSTQSKQVADMTIKYETAEKEKAIKDLQAKEQQAILQHTVEVADLQKIKLQRDFQQATVQKLNLQHDVQVSELKNAKFQQQRAISQSKLQQTELQKIGLQRHIQDAELDRVNLQRNITFGGVATLFIISALAYNGYRNKQRSNFKLQVQQKEINEQNIILQNLLGDKDVLLTDKDTLLTEKDWLLKEVHHRVKNNLQIVMSLLSSQSAYLENTAALDAIRESQNRVQAISLIHQKLYSSNNVANIIMPAYVSDLVGYLADCFDTRARGIRIEQLIESINLDLAQAVPLGLIMNEAITNAIKYAFDKKGGKIIVALHQIGSNGLMLHISDNGKGLPEDFDLQKATSLGMEMMKALSKQLGGEFKISNNSGLHISVEFLIEREFSQNLKVTV
jgi:two-component sensor histidine kinase